jgi:hypothetical protein
MMFKPSPSGRLLTGLLVLAALVAPVVGFAEEEYRCGNSRSRSASCWRGSTILSDG